MKNKPTNYKVTPKMKRLQLKYETFIVFIKMLHKNNYKNHKKLIAYHVKSSKMRLEVWEAAFKKYPELRKDVNESHKQFILSSFGTYFYTKDEDEE